MSNYTDSHFLKLQDYIAKGSKDELSAEERDYEDLLFSVAGIVRREGRPAALGWLMADRGCTRHVADRIVYEAINLFYSTDRIKQEAWRNLLFEKLLNAARTWERQHILASDFTDYNGLRDDDSDPEESGKSVKFDAKKPGAKDFEAYVKIIKQAAALKRLSEQEDTPPSKVINAQMNILYGTNPQDVGIPFTNKQVILSNEYFRTLPKKHQDRIERELGLKPFDIGYVLDTSVELAAEVESTE